MSGKAILCHQVGTHNFVEIIYQFINDLKATNLFIHTITRMGLSVFHEETYQAQLSEYFFRVKYSQAISFHIYHGELHDKFFHHPTKE